MRTIGVRQSPFRAFTLIELLVVVAIIALLMAVLLPSLAGARKLARTAVCATKIRGICQVMRLYGSEWDDLIVGNGHSSGSFMLSPPAAGVDYPTVNASYASSSGWLPLSNTSCPNLCQIWDWEAPIAAEMNYPFNAGRLSSDRSQRYIQLTNNPAFVCPENYMLATTYSDANWLAPTTRMLSYNPAVVFQYVYDANDPNFSHTYWDVGFSDVIFPGYQPKIGLVGNPSQKIFIADGARWSEGTDPPDVNLDYVNTGSPGGQYDDYGPWSIYSRSYNTPNGRARAMRHGSQQANAPLAAFKFNAGYFDGHVETLDGLTGANPALWVPSGGQVSYDACFPEVQQKYFSGGGYRSVP
jgi:prepilin-type N-terminal cleavage/methylation domain-containing protein/prepilin-type processing-associated H-X9-DG protein